MAGITPKKTCKNWFSLAAVDPTETFSVLEQKIYDPQILGAKLEAFMMPSLSKEESRKRWRELRDLWNDYDPIGVMGYPDWPLDEYESYVGPTMRLLEKDANVDEIIAYLEQVSDYMGIQFIHQRAKLHATCCMRWYRDNWPNTTVPGS